MAIARHQTRRKRKQTHPVRTTRTRRRAVSRAAISPSQLQHFRAVLDNTPCVVVLLDSRGEILEFNREAERVHGRSRAKVLGKNYIETFLPEAVRTQMLNDIRKVLAGTPTRGFENNVISADGNELFFTWNMNRITDARGRPVAVVAVGMDITSHRLAEEQMRKLTNAVDTTADSVVITNRNGIIEYVNPAFERSTGYSRDEALGQKTSLLRSGKHDREFYRRLWETMLSGQTVSQVFTNRKKDGTLFSDEKTITPIKNAGGKITHFVVTGRDISTRVCIEQELKESRERLELALHGTDLGVWDWNIQTGQVIFSERWAEMLGFRLDEIEPHVRSWEKLVHPEDIPRVTRVLTDHLEGHAPFYEAEHRLRTKFGGWKWILDRGKVVEWDGDGKALRATGTHRDITSEVQAREQLLYRAQHDALTDLPNRLLFKEQLGQTLHEVQRRGGHAAVMFVDLDGFKSVNDRFGHETGDHLLQEAAARLKKTMPAGSLVARLGGDEFALALHDIRERREVEAAAQGVTQAISAPFQIHGHECRISCSIGISISPEDGKEHRQLMRLADQAMYRAKADGKNTYRFYGEIQKSGPE